MLPPEPGAHATCVVACHYPLGQEPRSVEWVLGPLACVDCHGPAGQVEVGSSHPVDSTSAAASRAACEGCHDVSGHLGGVVTLRAGDGTSVPVAPEDAVAANVVCVGCHDGTSGVLASTVAVRVGGWNSPTGDFHGARPGLAEGFGGWLEPPFERQQGELACTTCHDPHSSASEYLLRAEVNGRPILTPIGDQGVGAEALCGACHGGERHARCTSCHADTGVCLGSDPSFHLCAGGEAVDPAPDGTACFLCHGHEGIVNMPPAQFPTRHPEGQDVSCTHCHARSGGAPWYAELEDAAPELVGGVVLQDVTGTSAVVKWTTNEPATGWIELQDGEAGKVLGSDALTTAHAVPITGLTAGRSYPFRIRSADRFRNVLLTATAQLETISASGPPAPAVIDQPDTVHWGTVPLTLQWQPVTSPAGNPVQYRVQVDYRSPRYAPAIYESAWVTGTSHAVSLYVADWPYYWRVQARDAVTGAVSSWSASDSVWLCPDWICSD